MKPHLRPRIRTPLLIAALTAAVLLGGCTAQDLAKYQADLQATNQKITELAPSIAQARDQLKQTRADAAALPEGSPVRDALDQASDQAASALNNALAQKDRLIARVDQLKEQIGAVDADDSPSIGVGLQLAGHTAATAAPYISTINPAAGVIASGVGGLLATLGALVAGWERSRRKQAQTDAASLVNSLEVAKTAGYGQVDFEDDKTQKLLRHVQTPQARALVDGVQKAQG